MVLESNKRDGTNDRHQAEPVHITHLNARRRFFCPTGRDNENNVIGTQMLQNAGVEFPGFSNEIRTPAATLNEEIQTLYRSRS